MAIFTAIATAIFAGTALAGTFAVTAAAFALQVGASMALSYAAQALSGNKSQPSSANDNFSLQGTLQTGGTVPRSFNLGFSATAGSLVYANTWGHEGETPNAYMTQVIALTDLPGESLQEVWVYGERVTIGEVLDGNLGMPVLEYRKGGKDHLWLKYYNGTQTVADQFLVDHVASFDRPYSTSRVGYGIAYVVCTALVDDTLFTGFPTYKFALSGLPLYDISKDSTVGGVGSHRWSDRSTWGGDGDNLPAVQIYNLLRGITYNGVWLYGLQAMTAARLPASNWIAQINKCRDPIMGEAGLEATYRAGGQINVNAQTANAIEALLTACQGRISEIGGFYKIHLGAPDSPTFSWTDADLLSTEQQTYKPFFGLSDSVYGIAASYPFPAEGWSPKVAPPYYRPDLEERDGNRRLLANPSFDFVPYSAQVQRLMRSALDEAQRARTHVLSFPPSYWMVEPGDVGSWTSVRNGYIDKQFRTDAGTDKANLDVILHLTEVDPSDYDWDHNVDFNGVSVGSTIFPRPEPQGILDWFAEGVSIYDERDIARRPAIRLSWDGEMPGVSGITYQVRLASDNSFVTSGNTDQLAVGAIVISQSILPETNYQARGQYIPSSPRDMLWSDWLAVTTPDTRLSLLDFETGLRDLVTAQFAAANARIASMEDFIASIVSDQDAHNRLEKKVARTTLDYREKAIGAVIDGVQGELTASIDQVSTIAASTQSVLASYQVTVSAGLFQLNSSVNTNATAVANLNNAFSSYTVTTSAAIGGLSASVAETSTAVASVNGKLAAAYGVTLNVNGYASGFRQLNSGTDSAFIVAADIFQVAFPSVGGGAPKPVFQVANVNGGATLTLRGDMYADGHISARNITAGAINAYHIQTQTITSDSGVIGNLAVKSFSIGDNAVIVPVASVLSNGVEGINDGQFHPVQDCWIGIDTTGLAGKTLSLYVSALCTKAHYGGPSDQWDASLVVNGYTLSAVGGSAKEASFSLGGVFNFVANGGYMTIQAVLYWRAYPGVFVGNRTLSILGIKR